MLKLDCDCVFCSAYHTRVSKNIFISLENSDVLIDQFHQNSTQLKQTLLLNVVLKLNGCVWDVALQFMTIITGNGSNQKAVSSRQDKSLRKRLGGGDAPQNVEFRVWKYGGRAAYSKPSCSSPRDMHLKKISGVLWCSPKGRLYDIVCLSLTLKSVTPLKKIFVVWVCFFNDDYELNLLVCDIALYKDCQTVQNWMSIESSIWGFFFCSKYHPISCTVCLGKCVSEAVRVTVELDIICGIL